MTNADRIRAMTDEELAKLIDDAKIICPPIDCPEEGNCVDCWLDYLKQEVKDNA